MKEWNDFYQSKEDILYYQKDKMEIYGMKPDSLSDDVLIQDYVDKVKDYIGYESANQYKNWLYRQEIRDDKLSNLLDD